MSDDLVGFLSALDQFGKARTGTRILDLVRDADAQELEKSLLSEDQAECPVYHHFGPGVYIREVWLKAGTFAIGHHQKKSQMNVMLKGKVRMLKGGEEVSIEAPLIYVGAEGKKMGLIEEDTIWLNIFPNPTDERDIDVLEDMYISKSEAFNESLKNIDASEDIEDFKEMASHFGFDESMIREQSENQEDLIPMPEGYSTKISVRKSNIDGMGLFANAPCMAGEVIAPARLSGMRTPAGRYTNHAKKPNCEFTMNAGGDIYLIAKEDIKGCVGGDAGTELTVSYYDALELSGIYRADRQGALT